MAGAQGRCLPGEGQEFAVAGGGPRAAEPDAPTSRRIPARAIGHPIASWLALRAALPARLPGARTDQQDTHHARQRLGAVRVA